MENTLLNLLLRTPAADHVPRGTTGNVWINKEGPVMTVQVDETLPRVFRKLSVEGFLSAPVLDGRRYIGFVDMLDLVKHTTSLFWGDTVESWVDFWDKEQRFQTATVDDVMRVPSIWHRDPYPPLLPNFTTFYAMEVMARTGLHRMVVVTPDNKITGILTQSMLISWLRQNIEKSGKLKSLTVEEMTKGQKRPVVCAPESMKTINAFNKMVDNNVSGLAVVNDDGVLTGVISVRDLRAIGTAGEYFHRLFYSIKDFKRSARQDFPRQAPRTHFSSKLVPVKGLHVSPEDTFEDVIRLMNDGNIHRVFVCSKESIDANTPIPIHCITQTDILQQVLQFVCKAE